MKVYFVSLAVGLLAGILYGLLGVKSPAPPLVALVGLLGLLVGEQAVAVGRRIVSGQGVTREWFANQCAPLITGVPATTDEQGSATAPKK